MIFLVLSGKIMFLFPKNMILHLRRKMKDHLCQNNTRKYDIFFKLQTSDYLLQRWSFQKGCAGKWSFLYYLKRWCFFSRKHDIFFLGQEVRDDCSQEIHGNMIFSVYTYGYCRRGVTPLCQEKSKMVSSRKNTPKGDWCSRLTS